MKSIAKDGTLKSRGGFDDYEYDDPFFNDDKNTDQAMQTLSAITPAFVDFVCHSGGIESFKRSNYYTDRLNDAKKYQSRVNTKKSKSAKKPNKDFFKKKLEDVPTRALDEMKKVKKNSEATAGGPT